MKRINDYVIYRYQSEQKISLPEGSEIIYIRLGENNLELTVLSDLNYLHHCDYIISQKYTNQDIRDEDKFIGLIGDEFNIIYVFWRKA